MSRKLNDKELEMVQRFLDMELTDVELKEFQRKMESDTSFKEQVDRFRLADLLTGTFEDRGLGQEERPPVIKDRTRETSLEKGKASMWKWSLPLLFLFALAVAGYFILNSSNGNTTDSNAVFAQVDEYVDKMSDNIMRGKESQDITTLTGVKKTLSDIKQMNEKGSVEQLILELEKMNTTDLDDDSKEVISWWLVKAYSQKGNRVAAEKQLKKIADTAGFNSVGKARDLLKELRR